MTTNQPTTTRSTLPATTRIGQVHLRVADLQRSLAFYRDILGYQVEPLTEPSVRLIPAAGKPAQFQLNEVPGVPPKPWKTAGLFHAAIRVPTRTDLAQTIKRVIDHGWQLPGMADHGVSEAFYLNDPDGNGLEIYTDRPREMWPRRNGTLEMVSDPIDLDSLFGTLSGADDDLGSMPSDSDIGHVHLQVSDLDRAERFYAGILGFDVMQRSYRGALFVSAGGYHHHVGLNIWAGQGVPGPQNHAAGLVDFAIVLPDGDSLNAVAQRLEDAGIDFQRLDGANDQPALRTNDPDGIGVVLDVDPD